MGRDGGARARGGEDEDEVKIGSDGEGVKAVGGEEMGDGEEHEFR